MTTSPMTRLSVLALVMSVAFLAIALSPLLFGQATGGDLPIHRSDVEAIADALRVGDLDLWLMNLGAGHPAGLTAPLLPPLLVALTSLITGLSSASSLSLWLAMGLLVTPIAVTFGAILAGLERGRAAAVGAATALLASTSPWGLGPASAFYGGLLSQVVAGMVWPVALGATIGALRGRLAPGSAVVAVVLASACHPMSAFFVAVGAAVAVMLGWLSGGGPRPALVARLVAGGLLGGLGVLGPGLVGARHWAGFEQRVVGDHGDSDIVGLLLEGLLTDFDRAPILLLLALATTVLSLVRRASLSRDSVIMGGVVVVVAAGLVGAGPWLPTVVPWGRFLCLVQLGLALLAGLAPALLTEALADRWTPRHRTGVLVAIVGSAFVVAASGLVHHASALAARPLPVDEGWLVAEREAIAPLRQVMPAPRVAALPLEAVSALELTRPFVDDRIPALFALGGPAYQSSPLRGVTTHLEPRHARLLHIGAILSRGDDGAPTVTLTEPGPLCEGFPIDGHVDGDDDDWQRAVRRWLEGPATGTLVRRRDGVVLADVGRLTTRELTAAGSRIGAVVEVERGPALLVCKVGFHPWWQAHIDDREAAVVVAAPRFLAVVVPPGIHQVRLRFERPAPLWLFWLGLPVGILVAGRRRVTAD